MLSGEHGAVSTTRRTHRGLAGTLIVSAALAALTIATPANAVSLQPVDIFGDFSAAAVAVNESGAGPAAPGDIYVIETQGQRIQRFGLDDAGTPGVLADDSFFFVSAWGADVVQAGGAGDQGNEADANYEVCTVEEQCTPGVPSAGNGTPAGNGTLARLGFDSGGIAVDQETGQVYVSDSANHRVNVYEGDGAFLRSFGFDVAESGPGDTTADEHEVCVAAEGDVCQAGGDGDAVGEIGNGQHIAVSPPDGSPSTGTVFVADAGRFNAPGNRRIDTYDLDGSDPGSFGSAAVFDLSSPGDVAVDSRGIVYASNGGGNSYRMERYDSEGANGGGVGFLAPIERGVAERQRLTVDATSGTFRLSFDPDGAGSAPAETTVDLPVGIGSGSGGPNDAGVEGALRALNSLNGAVEVFGFGSGPHTITFKAYLGAADVPELTVSDGSVPLSGGAGASVETITEGQPGLVGSGLRFPLAVDPDTDGAGPDTDVLYTLQGAGGVIQQFGPTNAPGLTAPPTADDERHGTSGFLEGNQLGLAVEPASGRLFVATTPFSAGGSVFVLGEASPTPPEASLDSLSEVTATSLEANATIDPNGPPATSYRFEYSSDGGASWTGTPTVRLGSQDDPQAVSGEIDATVPAGLAPNTEYEVRLVTQRLFSPPGLHRAPVGHHPRRAADCGHHRRPASHHHDRAVNRPPDRPQLGHPVPLRVRHPGPLLGQPLCLHRGRGRRLGQLLRPARRGDHGPRARHHLPPPPARRGWHRRGDLRWRPDRPHPRRRSAAKPKR